MHVILYSEFLIKFCTKICKIYVIILAYIEYKINKI